MSPTPRASLVSTLLSSAQLASIIASLLPMLRLCRLRRLLAYYCVAAATCGACGACGAAWQPSLPRSRGPKRSHRIRRWFRLRRFHRCAAAACIISRGASPYVRWDGGCVLVRMEVCMCALTNRVRRGTGRGVSGWGSACL